MKTSTRILLGYIVVLGISGYFLFAAALETIKPSMRQSAEETLVDTANLLALLVAADVKRGTLTDSDFAHRLHDYAALHFDAEIWGVSKGRPNHRIYITDALGRVIFDSTGKDVGADYSRWNDVYLTLHGRYGARSTPDDPGDEKSTVMHVAAPIRDGERIIGVLTVAKPNLSIQPFIDLAERRTAFAGLIAIAGALAVSMAISWWLTRSTRALERYARDVSAGRRVELPHVAEPELAALGTALEDMRVRLDGKAYVEQYVQTLTHELKSPLASILGASELLRDELPAAERARFLENISSEAARIQQLIERLLNLAQIEQRRGLQESVPIMVHPLVDEVAHRRMASIHSRQLNVVNDVGTDVRVAGERFLLEQALDNLLDNALAFTPDGGRISFTAIAVDGTWELRCHNNGAPIPDYALPRLTERFFSLPRPDSGRKSSGLGLSFVAEVAALHHGSLAVSNDPAGGVSARLTLPAA